MPSNERTEREVTEIPESPTYAVVQDQDEACESTQPAEEFNSNVERRLGQSPARGGRVGRDPGLPLGGGAPVLSRSTDAQAQQEDRPFGDSQAARTLDSIHQLSSTVAGSVNIIDHQFKTRVLARLGALEKQVEEDHAKLERCSDTVAGLSYKVSHRKGAPCDLLERLDSMVGFAYAFCKGIEDAGIFELRKFGGYSANQ